MKRVAYFTSVLLTLLIVGGCTSKPTTPEGLFATSLSADGIKLTDQLTTQARAACDQVRRGTDPNAVAVVLAMKSDIQLPQASHVLQAGVRAFCPDQTAAIDALQRGVNR